MADAIPRSETQPSAEADLPPQPTLHPLVCQRVVSRGVRRSAFGGNEQVPLLNRLNLGKTVTKTELERK